jgi:deoxyribodipyrimidine photo-lyase
MIKSALGEEGVRVTSHKGALLFEPWEIATKQEQPYRVFTPFWKACTSRPEPREPLTPPKQLTAPGAWPESVAIDDLALLPSISWDEGIRASWTPGENGARDRLEEFLDQGVLEYTDKRDLPAIDATSRMSPHLHFGEISPRTIWHETKRAHPRSKGAASFLREVGWREFAHHVLFHFPDTTTKPLRPEFAEFPWDDAPGALSAWQRGQTGYPIVDAGMRQLWSIGWMHNRVRMIVASFLVKDLRVHWLEGARWFWDTLVDADLPNNTMGWQWTAGCGADAAPYFRVFNPLLQGQKFDPDGTYVREWVPELEKLPPKWIHRPWEAPEDVLRDAGVRLGESYPQPLVDHAAARNEALAAFDRIKKS